MAFSLFCIIKMSFQSMCNALCISDEKLVKCNNLTENVFCNKHSIQYKNKDKCSICFETVDETTEIPLKCGHWFHKECIKPTNIYKCPLCQKRLSVDEITFIFGTQHIECNSYNDGNSIYWEQSNDNEQELMETYDDDYFRIIESLYGLRTREEVDYFVESIEENKLESEYITERGILTRIPTGEADCFIEMFEKYVSEKVLECVHSDILLNNEYLFRRPIYNLLNQMNIELKSFPDFLTVFSLFYNFNRLSNQEFTQNPIKVITELIDNIIIKTLDSFKLI